MRIARAGARSRSRFVFAGLGVIALLISWLPGEGRSFGSPAAPPPAQESDRQHLLRAHDLTNFPLVGKHRLVACGQCHLQGQIEGTPMKCEECHWIRSADDVFRLELGAHCQDCHTPETWKRLVPGSWNHEAVTGFRLEGKHRAVDCVLCHGTRGLRNATAQCSECHLRDFQKAKAPDHVAARFPAQCEICHLSAAVWQGAKFDHSSYPLLGQHKAAACAQCHVGGRYAGTSQNCFDCHGADYHRTTDPPHRQGGFPTDCATCHGTQAASWLGATYDHDRVFPLQGKHKTATCGLCHAGGRYAGTSQLCFDCHRADYDRTTNPNHRQAGFPTECAACHGATAAGWLGARFDHDRVFPLVGRHKSADCKRCHVGGRYSGTPSNCFDCHRADYDRAANPDHKRAGFSTDCVSCHGASAVSWQGASFDHDRVFPLHGKHRTADCSLCHAGGRFAGTPTSCVDCHRAEYDRTTQPNHAQAGFPTDCASCHGESANGWAGAKFTHDRFPLKGRHKTANCSLCHAGGRYLGTPSNCIDCHRAAYDRTTRPNHAQAGFSTQCVACHGDSATGWAGANFAHDRFPLRGKHKAANCNVCHAGGRFLGTPSNCIDCHRGEYDRTTAPNHRQAGFPTECTSCHGTAATGWQGAVFDHNRFFPLRGAHTRLDCQACHRNGYRLPKDCYGCHAANYQATRNPNHAAAGFSTSCDNCHLPTHTTWNQAVFQHNFPITSGAHNGLPCAVCHRGSNYRQFSCVECHAHEKTLMDQKHVRVPAYTYNSPACWSCHPNGRR